MAPGPRMTDEAFIRRTGPRTTPGLKMLKDAPDGSLLTEVARYFRSSRLRPGTGPERTGAEIPIPTRPTASGRPGPGTGLVCGDRLGSQSNRLHRMDAGHPLSPVPEACDRRVLGNRTVEVREGHRAIHRGLDATLSGALRAFAPGGYPWGHSLVVAIRPFSTLVDVFRVLCSCPETDDATIIDMLKSIYEHQACLLRFQSFPPSNKTIAEARTIAALGCAFPEFRDAAGWREEGYRRLLDDMRVQVMPDGASYELTPGYR